MIPVLDSEESRLILATVSREKLKAYTLRLYARHLRRKYKKNTRPPSPTSKRDAGNKRPKRDGEPRYVRQACRFFFLSFFLSSFFFIISFSPLPPRVRAGSSLRSRTGKARCIRCGRATRRRRTYRRRRARG